MESNEYLNFAKEMCSEACKIMKKYFYQDSGISYKGDRTIVTLADKEINHILIEKVKEKFPNHSVDGETETIPTQALTLAWSNMTVYGGELLANVDANVTDVTAPVRLATNILKDGESNNLREYYVKRGDTIYMYIAVNEELAHNPTFTLINNGKEYVM